MVDPQSEQVMLKLSPLTFPYVMVACLQSHPPLFDRSKPDFTAHSFRYLDKLTKWVYLMIFQAERIEEGSKRIFAKLFQCFHIHFKMWQSINRDLRKNPLEIGGISLSNFSRSTQMIIPSERIHFRTIILLFSNGITSIPKQILGTMSPIFWWILL